jgi:hypothetical protein
VPPELAGQHDFAQLLVLALGGADQMAHVTVPPSAAARNEAASAMFLMLLLSTRVAPLPGEPLEGLWFDRTKEYSARNRGKTIGPGVVYIRGIRNQISVLDKDNR